MKIVGRLSPTLFILGLITAITLALNLYGIGWGLPHHVSQGIATADVDWAPDSLAPLGPLAYAKRLVYREPWLNKYPPLHFIVLAMLYSPYVVYLYLTGGLSSPSDVYPYGLTDPDGMLTIFTVIARLTSLAMGLGMVVMNYYSVKKLYDRRAAFIAAFLIATSYPIIHYSHNANLDIPQLFWFSCVLYSFVSIMKDSRRKDFVLFGVFTALAFMTKESIYAVMAGFIPSLILIRFLPGQENKFYQNQRGYSDYIKNIVYGFLAFLIIVIFTMNPIMNWDGLTYHINYHLLSSVRGNWVIRDAASKIQGHLQLLGHYTIFLVQSNGIPVFILFIFGYIYTLIKYPHKSWFFLIPIITYYILFLRVHGTQHLRYILPVFILCTWQAGKFAADLYALRYRGLFILRPPIIAILLYSLLYGVSVNWLYWHDSRYTAEEWLARYVPEDASLVGVGPGYSLPRFRHHTTAQRLDLWNYNGEQIADITGLDPDYIVINMSREPMKSKRAEIEEFFKERGYHAIARFKTEVPFFVVEIPDLHTINPELYVYGKQPPRENRHSGSIGNS
jgi:4-amino-4-deoxy-L-arabinose transferase-like glycosyltransferase